MTEKTYEVIENLAPEGHKNCGYGCDSPYVANCNCSGYYPKVCPRHKVQVVTRGAASIEREAKEEK